MTCLSREQIALAATVERDLDEPHLADCVACRSAVADQRAIRELVRRAPAPPLPRARREAIAAEVAAMMEMVPRVGEATEDERAAASQRAWHRIVGAALAVAAAVVVLAHWPTSARPVVPQLEVTAPGEPVSTAVRSTPADAERPAIARADGAAEFTRAVVADRDVISLRAGAITLDALDAHEVEVTLRGTTVRVDHAKVRVLAQAGAIASVMVFAGSAEVTAGGRRTVIEAGTVWVPDAIGPAAALGEFRAGWEALREGRARDAIAAFDRATDPVVAEDAAYWAAVAAERAGARDAARRFTAFVARFPDSPRVEAARRAIARVTRR